MAGLAYASDDEEIFGSATAEPSSIPPEPSEPEPRIPADQPADSRLVSEAIRNLQPTSRTGQALQTRTEPQPPAQPAPEKNQPDTSDPVVRGLLREVQEERRRRQELEQRFQPQQPQQPERDIAQELFENPRQVIEGLQQSFATQLASVRLEFDLDRANDRHGETFQQAFQAFIEQVDQGRDRNTYERVMRARSPGEEIVAWYKQNSVLREVGEDPQAYRERVIQEYLASQQGGQPQQQAQRAPQAQGRSPDKDPATGRFVSTPRQEVRLPTATSRIPGATSGANDQGEDGSEEAIFESGRARRR